MDGEKESKQQSKYFKTAELMDEALLLLLEKKDYDYISVKEVCQKAGVNRSTFYLHYENMNDLLEETIAHVNRRFYGSFPSGISTEGAVRDGLLTTSKYLTPYLTFIRDNKKVFRLINDKPELFHSSTAFRDYYERIIDPILDKQGVRPEEKEYVLAFYMGGTIDIVKRWLAKDCQDPIPFIVSLIERFTNPNGRPIPKE